MSDYKGNYETISWDSLEKLKSASAFLFCFILFLQKWYPESQVWRNQQIRGTDEKLFMQRYGAINTFGMKGERKN